MGEEGGAGLGLLGGGEVGLPVGEGGGGGEGGGSHLYLLSIFGGW